MRKTLRQKQRQKALKWYVSGVLIIIIGIGGVMFLAFPIMYRASSTQALSQSLDQLQKENGVPRENRLQNTVKQGEEVGNRIIIPSAGIDMPIIEGEAADALNKGAWHYPLSSTPEGNRNIVISGHRFQFGGPNKQSFFTLNQVTPGDSIQIVWNNVYYEYTVTDQFVVGPNDVSILENGTKPKLTLYTCTPLFTTLKRLVVTAEPLKGTQNNLSE